MPSTRMSRLVRIPRTVSTSPAPGRRQPAEPDRKDHDEHHALPEIRQAEAEDRSGHDRSRRALVSGLRPGPQAERDADDQRQGEGHECQFQGRRHAVQDQIDRGLVEHEGPTEVAVQGVPQEGAVLLDERLGRGRAPGSPAPARRASHPARSECRSGLPIA